MTPTSESKPREVLADSGVRYSLGAELGRGGQGAVFATADGRHAVKVLFDRSPARRDRLRQQLTFVRQLNLSDVPIVRPEETLRAPYLGYVMRRLTGMTPLQRLLRPPADTNLIAWYRESGGLRRRLQLCLRLAQVMAVLHGRGLCFGDLAPNNVFVSAAADACELRLIDADNLHYLAGGAADQVYTHGYGAPELMRGKGLTSTLSDVHALAVLCFEVLRIAHPLYGDAVLEGEPAMEDVALRGELPFIDHPSDDRNRTTRGLPADLVLSSRLRQLFEACFVHGIDAPTVRPGAARLADDLRAAAGATVLCPECGWSYYYSATSCPDCEQPRPALWRCEIFLFDPRSSPETQASRLLLGPDGKPRRIGMGVVSTNAPAVFTGEELGDGSAGLELAMSGRELILRPRDQRPRALRNPDAATGGDIFAGDERRLRPGDVRLCHLDVSNDAAPRRVLRCMFSAEVSRASL